MIYGDNPQKINEREDRLGLKSYSFAPQISAVMQSGNLYVYCGNNPIYYLDPFGNAWYHWAIGGLLVAASAVAVVITAGGFLPAAYAISMVASGYAAFTSASTVAASAFIGSSAALGISLLSANYKSVDAFYASANWSTVAFTAGGIVAGSIYGTTIFRNSEIKIAGRGSSGRVEAKNLYEQLAMKEVISDPLYGATNLSTLPKNPIYLNDPRWKASDGWIKMQRVFHFSDRESITIHFVYNTLTKVFDDFKFVDKK